MGALTGGVECALRDVLRALDAEGYAFTTPAPLDHARVLAREPERQARTAADIFGWNLPFAPEAIGPDLFDLLRAAHAVEARGDLFVSRYRVARCANQLFFHGAFPTLAVDSVFFGPDSYRFAAFLRRELQDASPGLRIADIGTGAGVGALAAAACCANAALTLTDLNPHALRLARINADVAGVAIETAQVSALDGVSGPFDVIVANPPYLVDAAHRLYRDGGAEHGAHVSLEWTRAALARLAPGGRFLLYTGSAIVAGADPLRAQLAALAQTHACAFAYEEIEPDVWREELVNEAYANVDRIAVVGATFTRPA